MPKRRDEGTDVGDKGTEVESAARPEAPRVDSILLEYLRKPTAPHMPAVQADLENPEDERPTGRYSVPVRANSLVHVRDRAVLVRMDGDSAGEVLSLPRSRTLIGRSSGAHVLIVDATVGRTHAHITYDAGAYYIEDLGSQNGTEVAGKSVTRAELHDGDLIQVGQRSLLRFQLMDEAQERVLKRLYDSSIRDPLTGAENRRSLDGRLVSEIAFAIRHKRSVSVILLDIDFFKQVNDRHGHPAGDEVLRKVAEAIRSQLRTEDVLARYGGEEFAILLRDTALPEAVLVAERLRQRIARTTISINGEDIGVTISGGCSSLSCCVGTTPEELVGVADRRLYRAKRSGRNRIVGVEDA